MKIIETVQQVLSDLTGFLEQIDDNRYHQPIALLSGATLGQHVRHTVEFFQCLTAQTDGGVINYDKRQRNTTIEMNTGYAIEVVETLEEKIRLLEPNKKLQLEVCYDTDQNTFSQVDTSVERELIYNIEHAIHHKAIIKIGVKKIAPEIVLPETFGVAPSTTKYRKGICVQ